MGFLKRSCSADLESELTRRRPRPPDEFIVGLTETIQGCPARGRKSRIGAALAIAGVTLVALGASGYAYSSASTAVRRPTPAVHLDQSHPVQHPDSPARAQYAVPVPPFPPVTPPTPTPPPPTTPGNGGVSGGGSGKSSGGNKPFTPPTAGTGNVSGGTQGSSQGNSSSGLPFTGVSLVFPVLFGAALIVLGVFLRRRGRVERR
jgi:hypothetical protein